MKRPVPVVLSAILLGLLALFQLAGTASSFAVGVAAVRKMLPESATPSPFPSSYLPVLFFATSVLSAALAVWSILTLIGILRLRSWARNSILVIAGCMVGFGAISTATTIAMPFLIRAGMTQPSENAHIVRGIFLFMAALYAMLTAIGVALLVYYNLAKTRAIFLQNSPASLDPPNTSTGRRRPTALTVISLFFLLSSPFCALYAFFPMPAFLFGFTLYGVAAHITYITFAAVAFAIGYGLFRLHSQARIAMLAWIGFGFVNMLAVLTPWGSRHFRLYIERFTVHSSTLQIPNMFDSNWFIFVSFMLGAAFNIFLLWLLHRYRNAFTPSAPPPPMPDYPKPLAD